MYKILEFAGLSLMIIVVGAIVLSRLPVLEDIELITAMAGKLVLLPIGLFLFFFPKNMIIASVMFMGTLILILSLGGSLI